MTPEEMHLPVTSLIIFVSSPGDVVEERIIARRTIDRLADRFQQLVHLEPVFWEHEPLLASETFQTQIVDPAEADILICILWSRLGTRLPREITRPDGSTYASGTEYEFERALEGYRRRGQPELSVYRKTSQPYVSLEDSRMARAALDQKEALDSFLRKWFHDAGDGLKAAFHPFNDPANFEKILEEHLEKLIERRLEKLGGKRVAGIPVKSLVSSSGTSSPFRGLNIFDVQHSHIFFGRTRAISEMLDALRRQISRRRAFLLVLGMSGCGKSSLVRAGVLPLLTQPGVIEGARLWRYACLRPSDASGDLFDGLAAALLRSNALPELTADGATQDEIAGLLRQNPPGAHALVKGALSQAAARVKTEATERQPDVRLVLVVDQMEELFTVERVTPEQRRAFVEALASLAYSGRACVIATLRSNFYARCAELPKLVELKEGAGQYDLLPPIKAEFAQIIRQPAYAAGLRFESHPETGARVDDVLLDAVASEPESLPLLEFTLEELYKQRSDDNFLTFQAYEHLGGVKGSLARRAEQVLDHLDSKTRAGLPEVLRKLATVSVGDEEVFARKQAPLETLRDSAVTAAIVDAFIDARLFTTDRADDGTPVVRVTHEALFTECRTFRDWLGQDRELLHVRSRIAAAAERWRDEDCAADFLLQQGKQLQEAVQLLDAGFELSEDENAFITASLRRSKRQTSIKQAATAALVLLTIFAVATSIVANSLRLNANKARVEKETLADKYANLAKVEKEARIRTEMAFGGTRQLLKQLEQFAASGGKDVSDPKFIDALQDLDSPVAQLVIAAKWIETDPGKAITALRRTIDLDEKIPQAHGQLGRALAKKGDLGSAKTAYEEAMRLDPGSAVYRNDLGWYVYYQHGKLEEAIAEYRQAIAVDPGFALAHANLGLALAKLGQIDEAAAAYRKAVKLDPTNAHYQNNLGFYVFYEHGRYAEAAAEYQRAIAVDPGFALAHANLGWAFAKLGQIDEAAAAYRKAVELDPTNAQYHNNNLGFYVFFEHGRYAEAAAEYQRAVAVDPGFALAHANLGSALAKLGQIDEAAAAYRKAVELDPTNAQHQNNLGFYIFYEHGRYAEATAEFRRAIEIDPNHAAAHNNLGRCLVQLGKIDEAIAEHRRAIQLQPTHAWMHKRLGDALAKKLAFDEADSAYRQAIQIDPTNGTYYSDLASVLVNQDRKQEAIDAFRKALDRTPDLSQAHCGLAEALLISGQAEDARLQLQMSRTTVVDSEYGLVHAYLWAVVSMVLGQNAADAVKTLRDRVSAAGTKSIAWSWTAVERWVNHAELPKEVTKRIRKLTEEMKQKQHL